ncbi:DUF4314 domain-containing protein [Streptomyces sp. NPDC048172]|uniref:DUF4314 domain-containing protein n=1 Tax=Streptomyces sp. NPDC048172 TaxID=3365505 RepID=UPI0037183E55
MNFAKGDRVELVHTNDPYTRLEPGDQGTVYCWDAHLGHLEVAWDSGSRLSMIPSEGDRVRHAPSRLQAASPRVQDSCWSSRPPEASA